MNENDRKIYKAIVEIGGKILGFFLSSILLYFVHNWIAKSFALPSISYLKMVAVYTSIFIIFNIILNPFIKKKK